MTIFKRVREALYNTNILIRPFTPSDLKSYVDTEINKLAMTITNDQYHIKKYVNEKLSEERHKKFIKEVLPKYLKRDICLNCKYVKMPKDPYAPKRLTKERFVEDAQDKINYCVANGDRLDAEAPENHGGIYVFCFKEPEITNKHYSDFCIHYEKETG